MNEKLLQPLKLDYASFRKTFVKKKKMQWARPSIWYDADLADTVDRSEGEGDAIKNVLDDSRRIFKHRTDIFTPEDRMQETRLAADYAYEKYGEMASVIHFLKWVLLLSETHSRKMLMLSGWRKLDSWKTAPQLVIHSRDKRFDERLILRVMMGIKKQCPGKHHNTVNCEHVTSANHDLCWTCHQIWQTRDDMPDWMQSVVRNDRKEYRRQAIEAIYHEEYMEVGEAA